MSFDTAWIPNAKFNGGVFSPRAVDLPPVSASATRLTDGDSIDSDKSIASDDKANISRTATDPVNNTSAVVKPIRSASPPAYRLAALPLGSPENPIEIEDEVANNVEIINDLADIPAELVPFQATVVDEEAVLRAGERISQWFIHHINHNLRRVINGRSRRARAAAGPVETYWTTGELMESFLEELDDILNNASRVELVHI
jgi:hypothetical protein